MCLSVHGGGRAWQGACMVGGVHGRGHAWWQGMCGRGHAWQGDMCGRGGMHATHASCQILRDMVIWSMSGQFASYWNAFLLKNEF